MQTLNKFLITTALLTSATLSFAAPTPGTIKWSFDVQGAVTAPVSLGRDGTIYAASQDQHIWAINPDGTKKWAYPTKYYPLGSPLVHSNGNIYFAANDLNFDGHAVITGILPQGATLWSKDLSVNMKIGYISPIEYFNGDLISLGLSYDVWTVVPSMTHIIGMFNNLTGAKTTSFLPFGCYPNRLSLNNFVQPYVNPVNGYIINPLLPTVLSASCLGPTNGIVINENNITLKIISNPTPDTSHMYSPINGDGRGSIYFGDSLGNLVAYSDITFTHIWTAQLGGDISHAAPTIDAKGNIYVGSGNGYVYSVAPDGTINWQYLLDKAGIAYSIALDTDGTVYVTANSGNVYALDSTGILKWAQRTQATTAPVVATDGTVYVGTALNSMVAINGE